MSDSETKTITWRAALVEATIWSGGSHMSSRAVWIRIACAFVLGAVVSKAFIQPAPIVLSFGTTARSAAPADDGEYVENLKAEYRAAMADSSGFQIYWNTFNATEAERERHDRLVAVAERESGIASERPQP